MKYTLLCLLTISLSICSCVMGEVEPENKVPKNNKETSKKISYSYNSLVTAELLEKPETWKLYHFKDQSYILVPEKDTTLQNAINIWNHDGKPLVNWNVHAFSPDDFSKIEQEIIYEAFMNKLDSNYVENSSRDLWIKRTILSKDDYTPGQPLHEEE